MTIYVKHLHHAQAGAPVLNGQNGSLITLLDACLINGYNNLTVVSLNVVSGVATVNAVGHGQLVGDTIEISGATPSALNDTWHVDSIIDADNFTFLTTESDVTATGTITSRIAPLGSWVKLFSDTNRAIYKSTDPLSTEPLLYVDDTIAQQYVASVKMLESATDIDTRVAESPTTGSFWGKSSSSNANPVEWHIVGDTIRFYYSSRHLTTANNGSLQMFGDIISIVPADAYSGYLSFQTTNASIPAQSGDMSSSTNSHNIIQRGHAQIGSFINPGKKAFANTNTLGTNVYSSINVPTNSYIFHYPVHVTDQAITEMRGIFPGVYQPLHSRTLNHGDIIENINLLPGKKLLHLFSFNTSGQVDLDISGQAW